MKISAITLIAAISLLLSCNSIDEFPEGSFGYDLKLLQQISSPTVLASGDARVVVVGPFQGRIFTSSSAGLEGRSYGWFRRDMISTPTSELKFSTLGGEDRVWFGPEAGDFSIFFEPGKPQVPENVVRPIDLDTVSFNLLSQDDTSVTFGNTLLIRNYQDYEFRIEVERKTSIYSKEDIERDLDIFLLPGISFVGFEARTSMKNVGGKDWSKENGLLSIWQIGCFPPTPETTVVIPTRNEIDSATIYFSEIDEERIRIIDGVVYYKGDADYLNKIGIQLDHTLPVFGSYSPESNVLTIVRFAFDDDSLYVNSSWEHQTDPYAGDVINVFNDGATENGGPFGPFYELETSSSAKELKVGESQKHFQATYHFEGEKILLNQIAEKLLGVNLDEIELSLPD
ncbi:DUF6786 family protein [Bacteroidota bacterium]